MFLNRRGLQRCDELCRDVDGFGVSESRNSVGTRVIDCGVNVAGGLAAGQALAEICLANLGQVSWSNSRSDLWNGLSVMVATDRPVAACMASQYAGWQVSAESYFAMGSGPMRAARGRETIFDHIGHLETPESAIGILESAQLPDEAVCQQIAEECNLDPANLTLLVAPTASLAGSVQVVARTVETALHKMHEIGFKIDDVVSGFGVAPLPPPGASDLAAIGRTNDAVLYGGEVTLWVHTEDDILAEVGPQVPSGSSPDCGRPFGEIFEHYDRDFYKIDPLLFSPAIIRFNNLKTGRVFQFGSFSEQVLHKSFLGR